MKYDIVVIGIGPAGISAGIYTSRARLKTLVIGRFLQSKLVLTHTIHNYFGFQNGIKGYTLLKNGIDQARKLGAKIVDAEVIDIKRSSKSFKLKDSKNRKYEAKAVVLATGSKNDYLGIKNETKLLNRGIHYCAVCDGPLYKNKSIVVVGGGNHAAEEALELRAYSKDITMVSHNNGFSISNELKKELNSKKIKLIESEILEFVGNSRLEKLSLKGSSLKCDAAFIAPGTASSASLARKLGLDLNNNSILVNGKGETSLKGVFAAGESTGNNKQIVVCAGEGCNAGTSAIKYLRNSSVYVDYA